MYAFHFSSTLLTPGGPFLSRSVDLQSPTCPMEWRGLLTFRESSGRVSPTCALRVHHRRETTVVAPRELRAITCFSAVLIAGARPIGLRSIVQSHQNPSLSLHQRSIYSCHRFEPLPSVSPCAPPLEVPGSPPEYEHLPSTILSDGQRTCAHHSMFSMRHTG